VDGGAVRPALNWGDVEWIKKRWGGKLILKGIMDAEDARLAVNSGADALIVSNHGGRQLDGAPSSIAALPRIAEAVGKNIEVWMDGGIRSGQDVLKARALGARHADRPQLPVRPGRHGEAGVTRAADHPEGAGHHHGLLRPHQHQQRGPLCAAAGHHPHAVTPLC
jgi:L-lactate dehydrogenase (cytochrome)